MQVSSNSLYTYGSAQYCTILVPAAHAMFLTTWQHCG
jgi:hypothetical protein